MVCDWHCFGIPHFTTRMKDRYVAVAVLNQRTVTPKTTVDCTWNQCEWSDWRESSEGETHPTKMSDCKTTLQGSQKCMGASLPKVNTSVKCCSRMSPAAQWWSGFYVQDGQMKILSTCWGGYYGMESYNASSPDWYVRYQWKYQCSSLPKQDSGIMLSSTEMFTGDVVTNFLRQNNVIKWIDQQTILEAYTFSVVL